MCYFITIGIPETKAEIFKALMPRNLHLSESSNPSLRPHIPQNHVLFIVTSGGCSCDLFAGEKEEDEHEKTIKKLRRKYKRKGWTESKIERAISQAISAKAVGLRDDVRYFLSDAFKQTKVMRIIIHWYNGGVETEDIQISGTQSISDSQFRDQNIVRNIDFLYILAE